MKKQTLILLIIASALTVTGLCLSIVGFGVLNYDMKKLNSAKVEENSYTVEETFENIEIIAEQSDIDFVITEEGSCRVDCEEQKNIKTEVSVRDGKLCITQKDSRKWYERIGIFWFDMKTTVYLTGKQYENLNIKNDVGDIVLPSEFECNSVNIKTETGNVSVCSKVSNTLIVSGETGNVTVNKITAPRIELYTETGNIKGADIVADRIDMSTETGNIELKNTQIKDIYSDSTTGKHTYEYVVAKGTFSAESTTGNILLTECDGDAMSLRTTTGNIKGSLASEKLFIVSSTTGKVDVKQSENGKICKATTTTGNVIITTK